MALDNFELWQRHNFSRNKCSKVSAPPLLFTNEHFVMQTLKRTFGFRTGFLCFLWVQRGPWRSLGSLLKISDHHFYFCFFFIIGVAHFQWKKNKSKNDDPKFLFIVKSIWLKKQYSWLYSTKNMCFLPLYQSSCLTQIYKKPVFFYFVLYELPAMSGQQGMFQLHPVIINP